MNPSKLSIKSIYGSYQQLVKYETYQSVNNEVNDQPLNYEVCQQSENNDMNFGNSFDKFANLLINNAKSVGEFLTILTPNVESNNTIFIRFMDNFSNRLLNTNPTLGVTVLKTLLNTVKKLSDAKKISITRFIWERKSFRSLIKHYPRSDNGMLYMTQSIFSNVFPKDNSFVPDLGKMLEAYTPLFTDKDTIHDLMQYLDDVFVKNIGYTYDDPTLMNQSIMSSTDLCVLCFVAMIKTLQSNYTDSNLIPEYMIRIFWTGINVVYITTHIMDRSISDSIRNCNSRLEQLRDIKNPNVAIKLEIANMVSAIKRGDTMIKYLNQHVSTIDTKYVECFIYDKPEFIAYVINNKKYDLIRRLINDVAQTSIEILTMRGLKIYRDKLATLTYNTDACRNRLARFVFTVLSDSNIPVHIKFDGMRLVLSHNLKNNILSIPNCVDILCKYILEDVGRLKELEHVHLIDLMIELSDTLIVERCDITELYMSLLPEFSEQYTNLLKLFMYEHYDDFTPQIMIDLRAVISASLLMIKNLSSIGKKGLSYIQDMLSLIKVISTTYSLIEEHEERIEKETPYDQSLYQCMNTQNIKNIFTDFKSTYIAQIEPTIIQMFKDIQTKCRIIITSETDRILFELFGSEYMNMFNNNSINIKIINSSKVPNDLLDSIGCDVVLNPYYVVTGNDTNKQYHLIDRKTYYGIIRLKTNPFTREVINKYSLDKLNEQDDIRAMRENVLSRLLEL